MYHFPPLAQLTSPGNTPNNDLLMTRHAQTCCFPHPTAPGKPWQMPLDTLTSVGAAIIDTLLTLLVLYRTAAVDVATRANGLAVLGRNTRAGEVQSECHGYSSNTSSRCLASALHSCVRRSPESSVPLCSAIDTCGARSSGLPVCEPGIEPHAHAMPFFQGPATLHMCHEANTHLGETDAMFITQRMSLRNATYASPAS